MIINLTTHIKMNFNFALLFILLVTIIVDIRKELKKSEAKPIKFIKGDFLLLYKGLKDLYDCIVTLFFIDVSKNIVEYIEIIHDLLKKGGLWINL